MIRSIRVPEPTDNTATTISIEPQIHPTRRQFITAAVLSAPPVATAVGTAGAIARLDDFRIRRLDVAIASLPPELEGLTLAHITDVHVGDFTNGKTLDRIADATNRLRADLVLLTGDLLNRQLSDLPAALDMVKKMDPGLGLYMCQGNHDLFEGRQEFTDRVKSSGVDLLVNESRTISVRGRDVQILGLQWGSGVGARGPHERGDDVIEKSVVKLVPALSPHAFPILLAHHPHAYDYARQWGIPLTLAGHTHGGQLHLTPTIGFGPWMFRYWSGLYGDAQSRLVVSNGVGNWFPLRVQAPAEIIHVTLRRDTRS